MITINHIIPYLEKLNQKEKDKLIINLLKKNKEEIKKIYYQFVALPKEIDDLFHDTKIEIEQEFFGIYYGVVQKKLAKAIGNSNKIIKAYAAVDKRPEKEAELFLFILDILFENFSNEFGTCWTVYDSKTGQLMSKLLKKIKKIHPDYIVEFEEKINNYIYRLKKIASHNDLIYNLPDKLFG